MSAANHCNDKNASSSQGATSTSKKPAYVSYKLLIDPVLVKGASKLYRFDGNVPDDPTYPTVQLKDPRPNNSSNLRLSSKHWGKPEQLELPVPKFKIDECYVGVPPPLEIAILNVNDNIDRAFLGDIIQKYGKYEELIIYYHPENKKHLGFARVLFECVKAAKMCVEKLNGTSVMGQVLEVLFDPFGKLCKEKFEDCITEKKKEPVVPASEEKPKKEPDLPPDSTNTISKSDLGTPHKLGHRVAPPAHELYLEAPPTEYGYGSGSVRGDPNSFIEKPIVSDPRTHNNFDSSISKPPTFSNHPVTSSQIPQSQIPSQISQSQIPPLIPQNQITSQIPQSQIPPLIPQSQIPPSQIPQSQVPSQIPQSQMPSQISQSQVPHLNVPVNVPVSWNHEGKPPLPPGPPPLPGTPEATNSDNEDSPKMDLDARIKYMLKRKNTHICQMIGYSPSKDGDNDFRNSLCKTSLFRYRGPSVWSDSEEETVESVFARKFKRNTFLPVDEGSSRSQSDSQFDWFNGDSPPPSPFLAVHYHKTDNSRTRLDFEADLDQISDDSSDIAPSRKDRDVSLSPLSPEDPSTIRLPPMPPLPPEKEKEKTPPLPAYPPPEHLMAHYEANPYAFPPYMFPWSSNAQSMHMHPHEMPMFIPQVPNYEEEAPPPPPDEPLNGETKPKEPEPFTPARAISAVLDRLVTDLRKILIRDCMKKIIEGEAYRKFENWFIQCEQEHKLKKEMADKEKQHEKTLDKGAEWPLVDPKEGGIEVGPLGLGLGFKASIPKLPSFRRKLRTPSPARLDEDSRKSYQDSDDDKSSDEEDFRSAKKVRKRLRFSQDDSDGLSSSSDESSSDSEDSYLSTSPTLSGFSDDETLPTEAKENDAEKLVVPKAEAEKASDWDNEKLSVASPVHRSSQSTEGSLLTQEKTQKRKLDETHEESKPKKKVKTDTGKAKETPFKIRSLSETETDDSHDHLDDHNYCRADEIATSDKAEVKQEDIASPVIIQKEKEKKKRGAKAQPQPVVVPQLKATPQSSRMFKPRTEKEEEELIYEFLTKGVDAEDLMYLKRGYELMLLDDTQSFWLNNSHWVDYPVTYSPPKKRSKKDRGKRIHFTGCARSEGYYKLTQAEKMDIKLSRSVRTREKVTVSSVGSAQLSNMGEKGANWSREVRSNQRRLLTSLGSEAQESDLLKFNQLKFRKKSLRFSRSRIHDWGLFAAEPIAADEMVIEYVGQMVRPIVADVREARYEAVGIGSSYLFRIDQDAIIDATRCGNLSRFINHSCSPNCYAKIITIEGQKKIVIYSKQAIELDEEITYDYKFPIETVKIPCLCASSHCRGTLN